MRCDVKNTEQWRDIPGYEGLYQASDYGNIRSLPRCNTKGRILRSHINSRNGYCYISLSKNNYKKTLRVHRLVMLAFNSAVDKKPDINHKDGDKTNNRLDNLEWCNQTENQKHAYEIGLQPIQGIKIVCLNNGKIFNTATDAAQSVGGKQCEMVLRVCRGERSHYRGWQFARYDDVIAGAVPKFNGKNKKKASVSLWR